MFAPRGAPAVVVAILLAQVWLPAAADAGQRPQLVLAGQTATFAGTPGRDELGLRCCATSLAPYLEADSGFAPYGRVTLHAPFDAPLAPAGTATVDDAPPGTCVLDPPGFAVPAGGGGPFRARCNAVPRTLVLRGGAGDDGLECILFDATVTDCSLAGGAGDDDLYGMGIGIGVAPSPQASEHADAGPGDDHVTITDLDVQRGTLAGGSGFDELRFTHLASRPDRSFALSLDGVANDGFDGGHLNVSADFEELTLNLSVPATVDARSPASVVVRSGSGDDRIDVRDGNPDTVSCGPGVDHVIADVYDTVASSCERLDRPLERRPPQVSITRIVCVRAAAPAGIRCRLAGLAHDVGPASQRGLSAVSFSLWTRRGGTCLAYLAPAPRGGRPDPARAGRFVARSCAAARATFSAAHRWWDRRARRSRWIGWGWGLSPGGYTLQVRARDRSGNVRTVRRSFAIAAVPAAGVRLTLL